MKGKVKPLIDSLSGSAFGLRSNEYAVPRPNHPGEIIIRKKPGHRPKDWKMPEGQKDGISKQKMAQKEASRRYKDPEWRARYEAEYTAWNEKQARQMKVERQIEGKEVRYLWDYVRIMVRKELDEKGYPE